MWVCPDCNALVPDPVNRKCPNGHGLFDRHIFGSTRPISFGISFLYAFLICMGVIALTSLLLPYLNMHVLGYLGSTTLIVFLVIGIFAIVRGFHWRRVGGPVALLAPRAFGMGAGCIAAFLLMLGIIIVRG